jgi:signal transduction histidine kinase
MMPAVYATQLWENAPTAPPDYVSPEMVYLFISLLLFTGLHHLQTVFQARQKTEEKLVEARQQLESRLRERAVETAKVTSILAIEMEERRRLQTQLLRSQKLEALGQLATGTAHYFRNILAGVERHIQPLLEDGAREPGTVQRLKRVREAAERAAGLTRQLMTFTRQQAMRREVLDLDEVITKLVPKLRLTLGEEIILRLDPRVPPLLIYADAAMMEQILMNLTLNARDAMPRGGQLTIGAARIAVEEGRERHQPEARSGEFVRLTMNDTGCGMSPENMGRVFEPFFTTKGSGKSAGLGLATIYGIVVQHGGWIEVGSEVDRGTVFTIYLPSASQVPQ